MKNFWLHVSQKTNKYAQNWQSSAISAACATTKRIDYSIHTKQTDTVAENVQSHQTIAVYTQIILSLDFYHKIFTLFTSVFICFVQYISVGTIRITNTNENELISHTHGAVRIQIALNLWSCVARGRLKCHTIKKKNHASVSVAHTLKWFIIH